MLRATEAENPEIKDVVLQPSIRTGAEFGTRASSCSTRVVLPAPLLPSTATIQGCFGRCPAAGSNRRAKPSSDSACQGPASGSPTSGFISMVNSTSIIGPGVSVVLIQGDILTTHVDLVKVLPPKRNLHGKKWNLQDGLGRGAA